MLSWIGIAICLCHSAMFSGLNLAMFGMSRLRLEVAADGGDEAARKLLELRTDSNFLLTTILWGNVAVNVLLAMLSDSVMAGAAAFAFSTFGITFFGEIVPQAYFSRHALKMGAALAPVLRFYQLVLFPFAKPSAVFLDWWLGAESIEYFREHDLRAVIQRHVDAAEADLDEHEGLGALNFLALDDLPAIEEGEPVAPDSVIELPVKVDLPIIPPFEATSSDPFVQRVERSGEKWVILTGPDGAPLLVMDADAFLRAVLFATDPKGVDAYAFCHRPLIARDAETPLGELLRQLRVHPESHDDDVVDRDIMVVWTPSAFKVITGADLLGRLLRGIVRRERIASMKSLDPALPPPEV